jgi:hypothetical protein
LGHDAATNLCQNHSALSLPLPIPTAREPSQLSNHHAQDILSQTGKAGRYPG